MLHATVTMFTSTVVSWCFVALITIMFNVHNVESIKCYVCNTHNDTNCAKEILPDSFKVDCYSLPIEENQLKNYTMCRKSIQSIEHRVNGLKADKNRIIRTCAWDDSMYKNKCYHRSGFGGKSDVCSCSVDYCNLAEKKSVTVYVMVTIVSLAIFIT
ncbi:uncharacterized protein LOC126900698 [Daktulosphaira vitifoliae]|uniref:uncharacterized protein LOC126900698 n=1 Tax=Daktulosphaira vitifoliae TaxID=58002 RepID=UPI0021AA1B5C|nr:uncharacterized protein LOC126900698 [Daktulosphaira vitifoliae]